MGFCAWGTGNEFHAIRAPPRAERFRLICIRPWKHSLAGWLYIFIYLYIKNMLHVFYYCKHMNLHTDNKVDCICESAAEHTCWFYIMRVPRSCRNSLLRLLNEAEIEKRLMNAKRNARTLYVCNVRLTFVIATIMHTGWLKLRQNSTKSSMLEQRFISATIQFSERVADSWGIDER